jgi:hypothetical protein
MGSTGKWLHSPRLDEKITILDLNLLMDYFLENIQCNNYTTFFIVKPETFLRGN